MASERTIMDSDESGGEFCLEIRFDGSIKFLMDWCYHDSLKARLFLHCFMCIQIDCWIIIIFSVGSRPDYHDRFIYLFDILSHLTHLPPTRRLTYWRPLLWWRLKTERMGLNVQGVGRQKNVFLPCTLHTGRHQWCPHIFPVPEQRIQGCQIVF